MTQATAQYLKLQELLQLIHIHLNDSTFSAQEAIKQGQGLMNLWQGEISSMQGDDLSPEVFSQWRSLQTEIHRELRLLNMDLIFLGSSRSPQTRIVKQKAAGDRLEKLLKYCTQIQSVMSADPSDKPEA